MEDLWFIVVLTQWMMYATAVSTWALRFLIPTPDEYREMFETEEVPRWYRVSYNLARWVGGNKSWQDRGPSSKVESVRVTPIPATLTTPAMVATTKSTTEIKPDREENP